MRIFPAHHHAAWLGRFPHLVLSSTGEDTDFVDVELAKLGISRRAALRALAFGMIVRVRAAVGM